MSVASLTEALKQAVTPEIEQHDAFMPRLQSEMREIAETFKALYARVDHAVTITYDCDSAYRASLSYSQDNFPDEKDYEALRARIGEDEDIDVFTDYSWVVKLDIKLQQFTLEYNSDAPEADYQINTYDPVEDKEENFPMTEDGYNKLICRISQVLACFLPIGYKVAYFEEYSKRQAQQMLEFVLE